MDRIITELKDAARLAGVTVREIVPGGPDLSARGGVVRLRGETLLFLDPASEREETVRLLVEALRTRDLDDLYLSPEARTLLERPEP